MYTTFCTHKAIRRETRVKRCDKFRTASLAAAAEFTDPLVILIYHLVMMGSRSLDTECGVYTYAAGRNGFKVGNDIHVFYSPSNMLHHLLPV